MAQTGRFKGVSFYFRLEFNTLQGKITSGFVILGVFAIILMAIATWVLIPALNKSQYVANVLQPTENQLFILSVNTERISLITKEAILSGRPIKNADLQKNEALLIAPLDSLQQLSLQWNHPESHLSLKAARLKAATLIQNLKELAATSSQEMQLQIMENDLLPIGNAVQQQAAVIDKYHTEENEQLQAFINQRYDNLFWVLAASFIASVLFGGAFATYIVRSALTDIKMLKNKILEVSEGKLIDPIPQSKNELNSIIKAVNSLTDNLHTIQQFAQEVGKGNFDTNIQVFNGENDLGQSLAGMRNSLKTVALEEKHRSWVATGLARFADLFRTSTEDLTTYYQTIISELVRYLHVNQAALYIVADEDSARPMLDLKACYAYGRLKFEDKQLAAGQGLVGQVFLEKQPLFLKNIPANFLQITSGLGEASPRFLAVVPLKVNETVNGVIEIASFQEMAAHEVEFLLKISENLSGALYNVMNVQTTGRLLEEAQSMAQAMQSQEEMLRQNSEELIATQEKLSRDLHEMEGRLSLYEQALGQGTTPMVLLNAQGKVELANADAHTFFGRSSMAELPISSLIESQPLLTLLQEGKSIKPKRFVLHQDQKGEVIALASTISVGKQTYLHVQFMTQENAPLA